MSDTKPPATIQATMADLVVFQSCVGLGLVVALERRGLIDRFELADAVEAAGAETEAAQSLLELFVSALRLPANDD